MKYFVLLVLIVGALILTLGGKTMVTQSEANSWDGVLKKAKSDKANGLNFEEGTLEVFSLGKGKLEEIERNKIDENEWKKKLSSLEFDVNFKEGTERPFTNPLNDNKKTGVYRSKVSGNDLFHSDHKFNSGTGWPSFFKPVHDNNIILKADNSLFMSRVEVVDAVSGAHLGHVFPDGPAPTGLRYCINGASLEFVEGVEYKEPKE